MVFPGEQTHAAAETVMELDDGSSKGLATIAAEGGDVQGFRVGFGAPSEIPLVLEALGVPKPTSWVIAVPGSTPPEAEVITPPPAPVEVDLGEIEVSLDDLDDLNALADPVGILVLDDVVPDDVADLFR